ncbi:FG-GAP repeat domain-containing protein [Streptomyces beigongshangae]|uniref:FG-GAP repeat domain-containing protein n=1 Tax=Streptomyces beigongshangae TaxID=2841597 RepID=UPI003D31C4FB
MGTMGKSGIRLAGAVAGCAVLLAGCGGPGGGDGGGADTARRKPVTAAKAPARLPVPSGRGSEVDSDFNGDGHRDLVLNDLVKRDDHGDDAGIGIVYGSDRGLVPGARQLLSTARHAAPTEGELPAVFDAETSCDLDGDGFTDLVVSTDPPYDGQGRPPVPLQILFGSSRGLTGKAVKLAIPPQARFGNDWPDQPVCGDFNGDEADDLVVHASDGQLSYLRGPFTRKGAPKAAGAPLASPGNVPTPPAVDVDGDGYDDLLVRDSEGPGASGSSLVPGGPAGPAGTAVALPDGVDVAFGRFDEGRALDAAIGTMRGTALRYDVPGTRRAALDVAGTVLDSGDFDGDGMSELVSSGSRLRLLKGHTDGLSATGTVTVQPPARGTTRVVAVADFDGDGRADLVVRSHRGDTEDTVAVHPGAKKGLVAREPALTFSTSAFLSAED